MSDFPRYYLMCCICFEGLTPETCAEDTEGNKWDLCKGDCAAEAGVIESSPLGEISRAAKPGIGS